MDRRLTERDLQLICTVFRGLALFVIGLMPLLLEAQDELAPRGPLGLVWEAPINEEANQ